MQTANEMGKLIGQIGTVKYGQIEVAVEVLDVKQAYGQTRVMVTPVNGSGTEWIDTRRFVGRV
jgi:hypothetical protein